MSPDRRRLRFVGGQLASAVTEGGIRHRLTELAVWPRQQLTSLPPGLTVLDVDISVVGIEIVLGVEEHSDIVLIDRAVRNRPLTVHR